MINLTKKSINKLTNLCLIKKKTRNKDQNLIIYYIQKNLKIILLEIIYIVSVSTSLKKKATLSYFVLKNYLWQLFSTVFVCFMMPSILPNCMNTLTV